MMKTKHKIIWVILVIFLCLYFLFLFRPLYRLGRFDEVRWSNVKSISFRGTPDYKTLEDFSYLKRGVFSESPRKWPILARIFYEGEPKNNKDYLVGQMFYFLLINDLADASKMPLGQSCGYSKVVCFEYSNSRAICIPYHTDEKAFYGADFMSEKVLKILKKIDTTKTMLESMTYNPSLPPSVVDKNPPPIVRIPSLYDEDANSHDANNLIEGNFPTE
jgi:hypothetical protein